MRDRKARSDWNIFRIIPRRLTKLAALVLAGVCITTSAIFGLRSSWHSTLHKNVDVGTADKSFFLGRSTAAHLTVVGQLKNDQQAASRIADYDRRSDKPSKDGPGERGVAVPFKYFGKNEAQARNVFKREEFNLMASDVISLQRELPLNRNQKCLTHQYEPALPGVSVIIVMYNEPLSSLLRTIWSVINRSRPEYLDEVILVDDFSDRDELKSELEKYLKDHFDQKVRLLRMPVHKGLIQGKLAGARNSTAEVLVFLDSHCEVNVGWLEPLLSRIKGNPKLVACPMVDTIHAEDMSYTPSANWATGLFSWSLYYRWGPEGLTAAENKRVKDVDYEPHRTPTFPGGLFAMTREWFFEAGSYDEHMEGWGGENLEMSFRIWMCGGSIEFIPCSRVAHISRGHTYSLGDQDKNHAINSARLAEVWMDDFKRLYYISRPEIQGANIGDIGPRFALRKKLQCHSFRWYLENVFAEKFILDEHSRAFGQWRLSGTKTCLRTTGVTDHEPTGLLAAACLEHRKSPGHASQLFALSKLGEFRREEWCLDGEASTPGPALKFYVCDPDHIRFWSSTKESQLLNNRTGLCLQLTEAAEIGLGKCTKQDPSQHWTFTPFQ